LTWTEAAAASAASARSRQAKIIKGVTKAAYYSKMRHTPQSLAQRLASSLFLLAALTCHEFLAVAQLDKAGAVRTEADAAHPDEEFCHAAHVPASCVFISPFSSHLQEIN
jgi:hypothetical protein